MAVVPARTAFVREPPLIIAMLNCFQLVGVGWLAEERVTTMFDKLIYRNFEPECRHVLASANQHCANDQLSQLTVFVHQNDRFVMNEKAPSL